MSDRSRTKRASLQPLKTHSTNPFGARGSLNGRSTTASEVNGRLRRRVTGWIGPSRGSGYPEQESAGITGWARTRACESFLYWRYQVDADRCSRARLATAAKPCLSATSLASWSIVSARARSPDALRIRSIRAHSKLGERDEERRFKSLVDPRCLNEMRFRMVVTTEHGSERSQMIRNGSENHRAAKHNQARPSRQAFVKSLRRRSIVQVGGDTSPTIQIRRHEEIFWTRESRGQLSLKQVLASSSLPDSMSVLAAADLAGESPGLSLAICMTTSSSSASRPWYHRMFRSWTA